MPEFPPAAPPAFTRILLARHGEVDAKWRRTVYGRLDVALSETGIEQSRRLGAALGNESIDAVVSSGLQRAEAAAAFVRSELAEQDPGRRLERVDDPRFLELDRGSWAGRSVDELEREDPAAFGAWMQARGAVQAPEGEAPGDVAARVIPAIDDWARRFPGGTVLIVAHLWVVRSGVAAALGLPMAESGRLALPPGGICEFRWPAGPESVPPGAQRPQMLTFGAASMRG